MKILVFYQRDQMIENVNISMIFKRIFHLFISTSNENPSIKYVPTCLTARLEILMLAQNFKALATKPRPSNLSFSFFLLRSFFFETIPTENPAKSNLMEKKSGLKIKEISNSFNYYSLVSKHFFWSLVTAGIACNLIKYIIRIHFDFLLLRIKMYFISSIYYSNIWVFKLKNDH